MQFAANWGVLIDTTLVFTPLCTRLVVIERAATPRPKAPRAKPMTFMLGEGAVRSGDWVVESDMVTRALPDSRGFGLSI